MSIELILSLIGVGVALSTFAVGRITSAISLGRRQGELETRVARLEEDVRELHEHARTCGDKFVSKDSFADFAVRVDTGITALQARMDAIYTLLVQKGNGE